MKLLFLLCLPLFLIAQSSKISNIPLPRVYIQNLDIYPCDTSCMETMLEHGQIFSFLAHADNTDIDNDELLQLKRIYTSLLNLGTSGFGGEFKIAMLLPYKKIGKYAASTTNSVFSYMLSQNSDFSISSFKIESEAPEDIYGALENIIAEGFTFVIAPMTLTGAKTVIDINPHLHVYFPTVNIQDLNATAPNFYFGGIDYKAQTQALFEYASSPEVGAEGYPDTLAWVARYPNLIVTRTFSKCYGLAGLRVGYSVSHPAVAELMNRVRPPFNVNSIALAAAEAALDDDAHRQRSVAMNAAGLRQLMSGFERLGLKYIPSVGNFISVDVGREAAPVYEALLREGVIVRPVANYGMPNHLRVTVGTSEHNDVIINSLQKVLAK